MPIIPPIAPAPTIQIFTKWFLIIKEDRSAHRSRAGYPGFRRGALTSRLVQDRGEARADPRKIRIISGNEGNAAASRSRGMAGAESRIPAEFFPSALRK